MARFVRYLQHIFRSRTKPMLLCMCVAAAGMLVTNVGPMSRVQGAEYRWQTSPLVSVLATPTTDPAPTPTVAAPPPVELEPPLVVGRPATQTSLPLVGALIAAIAAVLFLAVQRRQ